MKKYICIEGNIGSGKTTMARLLQAELKANLILEEFEENHFLPLFYKDPRTYAFSVEFSFLLDRYRQLKKLESSIMNSITVSDYYIEKCMYFAFINLNPAEFDIFRHSYNNLIDDLPKPDLLIYFHFDVERLSENIKKRSRDFESETSKDYLKRVGDKYHEFSAIERDFPVINFHLSNNDLATYNEVFLKLSSLLKHEISFKNLRIEI